MKITLSHGSGGKATNDLINSIFAKHFNNPILNMMEDSAVVDGAEKIAITTDSFVITPVFFKGGNIGSLAICGTVNDLLMRGATPKYITSAFIIEEGADTDDLDKIAQSMAQTAKEAGVTIVAGDTKVVDGNGGIYINTAGVGFVKHSTDINSRNIQVGDAIIVSGTMGDHHATVLSHRMGIENNIQSDVAPLCEIVRSLLKAGIEVHTMRDVTRGGLGTVLNELAKASNLGIDVTESKIPVNDDVRQFAKILGLNIMHMGNEGKLVAVVPPHQAQQATEIMRQCKYGENAEIIGYAVRGNGVSVVTNLGGKKSVGVLTGEGLPRIC